MLPMSDIGMLDNLDLNLLRVLDALLNDESVTLAAKRLGVSQSTASGMLARLRDAFGDPLFVRRQRGLTPTPRARALRAPVRRILEQVDGLATQPTFAPGSSSRTFRVAASDYAQSVVFAAIANEFDGNLRLSLERLPDPEAAHTALEKGELDLWVALPSSLRSALRSRKLFSEQYVSVVRTGHQAPAAVGLAEFCRMGHVLVSPQGPSFAGPVDRALARRGHVRQVVASVSSFASARSLVEATDLVATLPGRMVARSPGLRPIRTGLRVEGFTLVAAWHERSHRDDGHRWLRGLLTKRRL